MIKNYLFFIFSLIPTFLIAQQEPHFTQYIINQYILNPAIAGIENYGDVKVSHRHQWVGLQDAPVTSYLTFHMPIGKKDDRITATSVEMPGENPRGRSYWQDYQAARPHHGVGIKLIDDRTGPLNRLEGYLSYSYHLGISAKTSIAAGFEAGLRNLSLNRSKLDFGSVNPLDPAVYNTNEINQIKPDFGTGIYVYSSNYFVGLSAQQMIAQKLYFSDLRLKALDSKLVPHIFASAGYRFFINDDFTGLPSVMAKFINPLPVQFDVNFKLQYHELLWAGATFRVGDGIAAMAGINVSNMLNIGYSYDYTTTSLHTVSKGTHEIVIGFLINNKYGDWCPRNVW